ncbi:MAG: hypothetical protein JWM34_4228 [Ilumatobacteraceae bacterium]|nr:hypothetical protein [Ilumatobacteraceae bacterium]
MSEPIADQQVTTLELFLDLVFVFTVTQLTALVSGSHPWTTDGKAALILVVTWWMYDGYVWLTGNVDLGRLRARFAVFVGMGGFLTMAIAIPSAFGARATIPGDGGVTFGVAFLVVTVVHMALFATAPNQSAHAIWRIAPFNVGGALLVGGAGFVDRDWRWVLWAAGAGVMLSSSLFGRIRGWSVSANHFVERHGLVIIVALGESVVDVGAGASGAPIGGELIMSAMLGLALSASLWWLYFDRDDARAGETMTAEQGDSRARLGLRLAYTHLAMIAGIVVMSAGVKLVIANPGRRATSSDAANLAVGAAVYLLAESWFRSTMGSRRSIAAFVAAVLLVSTIALGTRVSGVAQLGACVLVMVGVIAIERQRAVVTPSGRRGPVRVRRRSVP